MIRCLSKTCVVRFGVGFACWLAPAAVWAQLPAQQPSPAPGQRVVIPRVADQSSPQPGGQRTVFEPVYREATPLGVGGRRPPLPLAASVAPVGYEEEAPPAAPMAPPTAAPNEELRLAEAAAARFELRGGVQPGEHPLAPAVRWAHWGLKRINNDINDYSCRMVKRERINGKLGDMQQMFVKIRHEPFSVYTYFLAPSSVKGQEALFISGQNDGNMLAHANGVRHRLFGTVSLKPDSMLAMAGNKYPITEIGIKRLIEQLVEIGEADMKYGECDTQFIEGAKINGRPCTLIQVVHPVPRQNFRFHLARIYVDDEMQLPVRYEAYDWPDRPGGEPVLTEEYTYLDIKVNQGFTDADFDRNNPTYSFK